MDSKKQCLFKISQIWTKLYYKTSTRNFTVLQNISLQVSIQYLVVI